MRSLTPALVSLLVACGGAPAERSAQPSSPAALTRRPAAAPLGCF
jgi:hypothetical protein